MMELTGADILPLGFMNIDAYVWIVCTLPRCDWRERFNFASDDYARGNGQIVAHGLHHIYNDH